MNLFPEQASTLAERTDAIFIALVAVSGFFTILIATLIVAFAWKYRRRADRVATVVRERMTLELAWSVIPLLVVIGFFIVGARTFIYGSTPPEGALEIQVVGKQWMWKISHPNGPQEINALHVPVGRPVLLKLASDDVIHSFFVPAFRVKQDVLPGRTTTMWFHATKPGTYALYCAEYCGTGHSIMIGTVVAMEPRDYGRWLAGERFGAVRRQSGRELVERFGCLTCHRQETPERGPLLEGLYGRPVRLAGGRTVTADDEYLRRAVLQPAAEIVEGYEPIMPTYAGQIDETDLLEILRHLKDLGGEGTR